MPQPAPITRHDTPAQMARAGAFRPASYSETDNSIEVCWSVGAAGLRFDWYDGGYYIEELSMEAGSVRLDRLNAGACLLDTHQAGSLKSVLGSIIPGSVRIANGEGIARVRLATTPDVADINAKIIDGHIRNLSVSYHVYEFHRTEREGQHPHMLATDWEPVEISMVAVPFDAAAQVRSEGNHMPRITENHDMDERRAPRRDDQRGSIYRNDSPSLRRHVTEDQIVRACGRAGVTRDFERTLLDGHQQEPMTETDLYRSIVDQYAQERNPAPISNGNFSGVVPRGGGQQRQHFADALYARLSGRPAPDTAREFVGASLIDMARSLLEASGEHVRWLRPAAVLDKLARAGAQTTSDFNYILSNAGQRYLLDGFSQVTSPLKVLARKRDFPDFKYRYSVQAEGATPLLLVKENAEFKRSSFVTAENGAKLSTYGRIFSISRQALVNDDLGAFADMATYWARAGSEIEANFLVAMIMGDGVRMGDTKTLYHVDHKNVAPAGSAITPASLSEARQQMRLQTNLDGVTVANVVPKYLVVGAEKETEAEAALTLLAAGTVADVNPFAGKLELVVDPRLTGKSWRLFADPAVNPVLEYGNLEGQDGLFTDSRIGFDVDGVDFKARTDIGAGAIDHRGTFLNKGA